jgi:hypothetical protein
MGDGTFAFRVPATPTDHIGYVGVQWPGGVTLLNFRQTTIACGIGAGMPTSLDVDAKGGAFTFAVALHAACRYLGVADADWLSATRDGTDISAGYLRFVIVTNPLPTPRVGSVSVLAPFHTPVIIRVTQSGG